MTKKRNPIRKHKKTRSKRKYVGGGTINDLLSDRNTETNIINEIDEHKYTNKQILTHFYVEKDYYGTKQKNLLVKACENKMDKLALKLINDFNPEDPIDKEQSITFFYAFQASIMTEGMTNVALKLIEVLEPYQIKDALIYAITYQKQDIKNPIVKKLIEVLEPKYINDVLKESYELSKKDFALELIDKKKEFIKQPALNDACEDQHKQIDVALELIDIFKKKNLDLGHVKNDKTPLIWACYNQMDTVANALIESENSNPGFIGTPPNSRYTKYKTTALILACKGGMEKVANAIFDKIKYSKNLKEIINTKDEDGNTALIWAFQKNLNDIAVNIINTDINDRTVENKDKITVESIVCHKRLREKINSTIQKSCPEIKNLKPKKDSLDIIFIPNNLDKIVTPDNWSHESKYDNYKKYLDNDVIEQKCTQLLTSMEDIEKEKPNILIIKIKENNEILGFCLFHKEKDGKDYIYIDTLCATNEYYTHAGTIILDEIIEMIKKNNMTKIKLEPWWSAVSFYKKYEYQDGVKFSDVVVHDETYMILDIKKTNTGGSHDKKVIPKNKKKTR